LGAKLAHRCHAENHDEIPEGLNLKDVTLERVEPSLCDAQ
jgi:hypothetical protein